MKTLIEKTDTSATYQFTIGDSTKTIKLEAGPQVTENPITHDFEALSEIEYQNWLNWINSQNEYSTPIDENGVEINNE